MCVCATTVSLLFNFCFFLFLDPTVGATPCPIWGLPLSTVGLTPAMGSTPLRWVASVLGAPPESPGKLYSLCHPPSIPLAGCFLCGTHSDLMKPNSRNRASARSTRFTVHGSSSDEKYSAIVSREVKHFPSASFMQSAK